MPNAFTYSSSCGRWAYLGFIQTNWGCLLGWVRTGASVHIFIFVRRCDLYFTLLLDLFRQVKANELLMNKSVKYSPPVQLPILMLLISLAFCAVFSYKAPNVGLQASSLGRDKHSDPGQQKKGGGARPWGSGGYQIFHPGAQSPFHLSRPGSLRETTC
jgi:hypothetical protein